MQTVQGLSNIDKLAVETIGQKKSAVATCVCRPTGKFEVRVNKMPLELQPYGLLISKYKEVINLIDFELIKDLDFEITTKNLTSHVSNIYAGRQAFLRAILSYLGRYHDEYVKREVKDIIMKFDRYAIVTDTRKKEAKKYGGPGARARYQKSYR